MEFVVSTATFVQLSSVQQTEPSRQTQRNTKEERKQQMKRIKKKKQLKSIGWELGMFALPEILWIYFSFMPGVHCMWERWTKLSRRTPKNGVLTKVRRAIESCDANVCVRSTMWNRSSTCMADHNVYVRTHQCFKCVRKKTFCGLSSRRFACSRILRTIFSLDNFAFFSSLWLHTRHRMFTHHHHQHTANQRMGASSLEITHEQIPWTGISVAFRFGLWIIQCRSFRSAMSACSRFQKKKILIAFYLVFLFIFGSAFVFFFNFRSFTAVSIRTRMFVMKYPVSNI